MVWLLCLSLEIILKQQPIIGSDIYLSVEKQYYFNAFDSAEFVQGRWYDVKRMLNCWVMSGKLIEQSLDLSLDVWILNIKDMLVLEFWSYRHYDVLTKKVELLSNALKINWTILRMYEFWISRTCWYILEFWKWCVCLVSGHSIYFRKVSSYLILLYIIFVSFLAWGWNQVFALCPNWTWTS